MPDLRLRSQVRSIATPPFGCLQLVQL